MNHSDDKLPEETVDETADGRERTTGDDAPAPFVAKLVEESDASPPTIRTGSPFRVDPPELAPEIGFASGEASYADFGPYRYTAMGAATAALLIVAFAGFGAWWFPVGGALVAVLGATLSVVGMFSPTRLRFLAIGCLLIHLSLFLLSYARSLA